MVPNNQEELDRNLTYHLLVPARCVNLLFRYLSTINKKTQTPKNSKQIGLEMST